jgi:hypothetical protein
MPLGMPPRARELKPALAAVAAKTQGPKPLVPRLWLASLTRCPDTNLLKKPHNWKKENNSCGDSRPSTPLRAGSRLSKPGRSPVRRSARLTSETKGCAQSDIRPPAPAEALRLPGGSTTHAAHRTGYARDYRAERHSLLQAMPAACPCEA